MYIARKLRSENIAEYILYLWQLEDLLRACEFNGDNIYTSLVASQGNLTPEQQLDLFTWYMDMVSLMREEDKGAHGHLSHSLHLISDLNDLHLRLLKYPIGKAYRDMFAPLAVQLPSIHEAIGEKELSDIEVCFRALYSVMLLRLKGVENKTSYISDVLELISPVIAYLSMMYLRVERGEEDLFKGTE